MAAILALSLIAVYDAAIAAVHANRALQKYHSVAAEHRANRADSHLREAFAAAILFDLAFFFLAYRRVTRETVGRVASVREAAREQAILATALTSIGDGVVVTDGRGLVTYLNAEAERLTGWKLTEATGRPLTQIFLIISEDGREPVVNPAERVLRDGKVVGLGNHTLLVRRDGSEVSIDDSAAPVRPPDGSLCGVVLVFRDISEQRRNSEARNRLAMIVESSDDAIFAKDFDGKILSWNYGAERIFGYTPAEAIGRPITLIVPDDRLGEENSILGSLRHGRRVDHFRTVRRRKDGVPIDVSLTASPIVDSRGKLVGISSTARDMTMASRFESELRSQVAARTAELSGKSRQLEEFVYTLAHDLRTPLRAIAGYADFIGEQEANNGQIGPYLEKIKGAAFRMDRLITDMLAYSRVVQVDVIAENVALTGAVGKVLQQLADPIQKAGAVVVVQPGMPAVRAEPVILEQALTNLLSNAVKFVPSSKHPKVEVWAEPRGSMVRIVVRDNGLGIPAEYHRRIFKVFERLRDARDYPGNGVGLAIVARSAERLGGAVGVESAPGQGSTFWIELPKAEA
ncbi:MAG: sensor histidine kinase [Opitutaceae bacterium]